MVRLKDRETHTRGGMRVESLRSEATHSSLTTLFYPANRAEAEGLRPAQNWRPERPERLVVGWLDRKTERHTQGGVCELSH